MRIMR